MWPDVRFHCFFLAQFASLLGAAAVGHFAFLIFLAVSLIHTRLALSPILLPSQVPSGPCS